MIASAPSTADTPRAHLVNPFALECLRDISVEDDAMRLSLPPEMIGAFRYSRSLLGEEFAKLPHWEGVPENAMNVKKYSPCRWVDLPQTYMEPILVNHASHHGFAVRFSTQLLSAEKDSATGDWVCSVEDLVRKDTYRIRTKFLFGADGGRSQVARMADAKFSKMPSQGTACNIIFTADLSQLMEGRHAQLHTILNPSAQSRFGQPVIRLVRPWKEWMIVTFTSVATYEEGPFYGVKPDDADLVGWIREVIGLDDNPSTKHITVKVHRIDPWVVRETVAENFNPAGNAFLLGDAAHRHPPVYGLGSNTCVQDGYNLGWKVAYVAKGLAGPKLLETYNEERQPVGAQLVREANRGLSVHVKVWEALGMRADTPEERVRAHGLLSQASAEGEERRRNLHEAMDAKMEEGRSLGLCMNQWYVSKAIYLDDEPDAEPRRLPDGFDRNADVYVSTCPGNRLPHAWLDSPIGTKRISTHDLAGKGAFSLFTSYGGDAWCEAAGKISEKTGIPINAYRVGMGLEWQDMFREWYERRGVEDSGCVLVRPDRFVAWRSARVDEDCEGKLSRVLNRVLSRE